MKYNMARITVKIEDGMVQAVEEIPADVTIEVRNHDVGGVGEKVITKDEKGRSCEIREWRAPEYYSNQNRAHQSLKTNTASTGLLRAGLTQYSLGVTGSRPP